VANAWVSRFSIQASAWLQRLKEPVPMTSAAAPDPAVTRTSLLGIAWTRGPIAAAAAAVDAGNAADLVDARPGW